MKKIILAFLTALVIAGTAQLTMGSDSLDRIARADIERALRHELSPLVGVFDHVAFRLDNDGTVTLLGQVREPTLKTQLEEDTMKVAGIKRVRNQIEVLPPLPSDDEIRKAVYNAIYSQRGLARYRLRAVPPIYIIVKNGFVTLEGVVPNRLERAQVNTTANDVPGVFSVKNNLHIDKGE
jgi:BON domain